MYSKESKDYGRKCVVLVGCTMSPIYTLLQLGTTSCDMTFISWNKAYCLFPRTTFVDHQVVSLSPMDDKQIARVNELETLGFTVRDLLHIDAQQWSDLPDSRFRFIGDKHTWRLNFDTSETTEPEYPDYGLEICGFFMRYAADQSHFDDHVSRDITPDLSEPAFDDNRDWCGLWRHICLGFHEYTHPSLRHSFLCHAENDNFGRVFTEVLDLHARRQIFKLDEAKRHELLNNRFFSNKQGSANTMRFLADEVEFERPKNWVYRDDLVLKRRDKLAEQVSNYELLGPENWEDYTEWPKPAHR